MTSCAGPGAYIPTGPMLSVCHKMKQRETVRELQPRLCHGVEDRILGLGLRGKEYQVEMRDA